MVADGVLPPPPLGTNQYPHITVASYEDIPAAPIAAPTFATTAMDYLGESWRTIGMIAVGLVSLVMLLFWRGTTKQGITAAIFVGMIASLGWILLSQQCYRDVYGWNPETAIVPFSQPGIVTIPLGFVVLVVVSLITKDSKRSVVT